MSYRKWFVSADGQQLFVNTGVVVAYADYFNGRAPMEGDAINHYVLNDGTQDVLVDWGRNPDGTLQPFGYQAL